MTVGNEIQTTRRLTIVPSVAVVAGEMIAADGTKADGSNGQPVGVAEYDAAIGEPVSVIAGIVKVKLSGAVVAGDDLAADKSNAGQAKKASAVAIAAGATAVTSAAANGSADITGGVLPERFIGTALEDGSASDLVKAWIW